MLGVSLSVRKYVNGLLTSKSPKWMVRYPFSCTIPTFCSCMGRNLVYKDKQSDHYTGLILVECGALRVWIWFRLVHFNGIQLSVVARDIASCFVWAEFVGIGSVLSNALLYSTYRVVQRNVSISLFSFVCDFKETCLYRSSFLLSSSYFRHIFQIFDCYVLLKIHNNSIKKNNFNSIKTFIFDNCFADCSAFSRSHY